VNGEWTDVENWLDLLDHIWIGIVLIAAAAVPSFFAARNHKGIKKVQDQVVNGHTTPMRADLDGLRETLHKMGDNIRDDMKFIKTELADIRSELHSERKERQQLDQRFEDYRKSQS